ncbi:MAG: AarF/ABC1/UbiB kinase family protein [Deltaproteobacteria bacterium]|nr:AarF/ABC1/UbiB kinase family protein [Deltaproteobacteria bacterium]
MIRHLRGIRVLRVVWALARVVPRYWLLLLRDRAGRWPPGDAAWQRAHAAAAREIESVALTLAGAFTKAAQVLGARADVLPAPFVERLSRFHDAVPPRPFATLAPLVERDLGRPLAELFAAIDERALAAASLAQVHRATLHDGRPVVVKIRYPEIPRIIPLDLGMLRRVVGIVQRLQSRIDLRALVTEVTRFIELELDFRREARSTERLAKSLVDLPDVVVPRVHPELCGENVLVLEYLEGIPVARTEAVRAAGHRLSDVARRIGALYGTMIFEHGFFHGDPHPGNLLVLPDGRIGLLDFGLCKELPPGFARQVAQMMVASLVGDAEAALAAAGALGFDVTALRPGSLRSLLLMMVGDRDTEAGVLAILGESRLRRIPEDFALVARTLVLLNGLSHRLAPGRRLVQAELLKHLAAGAAREAPLRPAAAGSGSASA